MPTWRPPQKNGVGYFAFASHHSGLARAGLTRRKDVRPGRLPPDTNRTRLIIIPSTPQSPPSPTQRPPCFSTHPPQVNTHKVTPVSTPPATQCSIMHEQPFEDSDIFPKHALRAVHEHRSRVRTRIFPAQDSASLCVLDSAASYQKVRGASSPGRAQWLEPINQCTSNNTALQSTSGWQRG